MRGLGEWGNGSMGYMAYSTGDIRTMGLGFRAPSWHANQIADVRETIRLLNPTP